jgi:hypothetical protein
VLNRLDGTVVSAANHRNDVGKFLAAMNSKGFRPAPACRRDANVKVSRGSRSVD